MGIRSRNWNDSALGYSGTFTASGSVGSGAVHIDTLMPGADVASRNAITITNCSSGATVYCGHDSALLALGFFIQKLSPGESWSPPFQFGLPVYIKASAESTQVCVASYG